MLKHEVALYILKNQGVDDIPALIRILTPLIAGLTFQIRKSSRNSMCSRVRHLFCRGRPSVGSSSYTQSGKLSGVRDGTSLILDARRRRKVIDGTSKYQP